MKCLFCQNSIELEYEHDSKILYGECKVHKQKREKPFEYPIGMWVSVDNEGICSSYTLNLEVDGSMYGYDSEKSDLRVVTRIYYMTEYDEIKKEGPFVRPLLILPYFTPLQDLQFYEQEIRRIMNLKAFL